MRSQQLEVRVLGMVERVLAGGRVEDDRVEAKSVWLTPGRGCARQIAGLANASGGEPVLWLVGLDEDGHRVTQAGDVEPADWWGATCKWFAELAPGMSMLQVPTTAGVVTALEFDTSRAPYLVKTSGADGVSREVPWREGNSTRSAHRSELLRSLVAEIQAPTFEPIGAWLRVDLEPDGTVGLRLEGKIFIEAIEPCRLPKHKWEISLTAGQEVIPMSQMSFTGPQEWVGGTTDTTLGWERGGQAQAVGSIYMVPDSALHVNGSDRISADWRVSRKDSDGGLARSFHAARRVSVDIRMPLALSSRVASASLQLRRRAIEPLKTREVREPLRPRQVNPDKRKIDTRIGLFEFGQHDDNWWWHESGTDLTLEAAQTFESLRRDRLMKHRAGPEMEWR